jgi:chondroitin AC lyase
LDYKNRLLNLKKSWFFFDQGMVALGADISAYSSPLNLTSVNQEWSKGPVSWGKTSLEESTVESGKVETAEGAWAYSAEVGYHFIKGKKIVIQNQDQKG